MPSTINSNPSNSTVGHVKSNLVCARSVDVSELKATAIKHDQTRLSLSSEADVISTIRDRMTALGQAQNKSLQSLERLLSDSEKLHAALKTSAAHLMNVMNATLINWNILKQLLN